MTNEWPELEELAEQMRSENADRWQRTEQLHQQLSGLQPHLEVIRRQYDELEIDGHLRSLNDRLLGGLGSVELIHSGMGIEHVASLIWPADFGLGQGEQESASDGVFRIEVWLGPGLEDGRARIRIAGAKRLEAVLPTTSAKFRSALLTVFRNPLFVQRPATEQAEAEEPLAGAEQVEHTSAFDPEPAAQEAATQTGEKEDGDEGAPFNSSLEQT